MQTLTPPPHLWPNMTAPDASPHDWTFSGQPTRELTHCYHDYPARMIPQVAHKLLEMFAPPDGLLFDPYCGTGTALVEGMLKGLNVSGTDLNPLARLIASAKTAIPGAQEIERQASALLKFLSGHADAAAPSVSHLPGVRRLDFWFKPDVVAKLSCLRAFVGGIEDEAVRLFFQVAFSETARESSNTRNDEFKLYRYEAERLKKFSPDVYGLMLSKVERNRRGLADFIKALRPLRRRPSARVYDFDTADRVPDGALARESVDIVVTSPPYGDSHTTVAYGQYSRLSAAWLGLSEPEKVDRRLMGGRPAKCVPRYGCAALDEAVAGIAERDAARAREVAAFYSDLRRSVRNVAQVVRPGGHACYVVGNRKVKGVVLPTHAAIRAFFEETGFTHVETFRRNIPNKRMPLRNSPTNVAGSADDTMTTEHIVVLNKTRQ
ncbi:MAG: DNA methyltransferase [Acidobacteria bacterium]|nr:DNA methyltransferase [Acidobacteriota bacterium]